MRRILLDRHLKTAMSANEYMQSIIDALQPELSYTMTFKTVNVSSVDIPYVEITTDNGIMIISLPVQCNTNASHYNIKVTQTGTTYTVSSVIDANARGIFAYIGADISGEVKYVKQTEFNLGGTSAFYFEIISYNDGITVIQKNGSMVMLQPFVMTYTCEYKGEKCISGLGFVNNNAINVNYGYLGNVANYIFTKNEIIDSLYITQCGVIGVEKTNPVLMKSSIYSRPSNMSYQYNYAVTLSVNDSMMEQRNVYDFFDTKGNTLLNIGQVIKLNGEYYIILEKGSVNTLYCGYPYLVFKLNQFDVIATLDLVRYPLMVEPIIGELEETINE